MTRLLPLLACALLAAAPAAVAREEDDEGELTRLLRDQSRMTLRLETLREKMARLAERYADEGRTRNATLLREALARLDEAAAVDKARELEQLLGRRMLSTVERQDEMVTLLEAVYAVLRDRGDVEELARQEQLARQGAEELGFLAENQRRLLNRTRAETDRPSELVAESLQALAELQMELAALASAAQTGEAARAQAGEAAAAAELARAQRALAESAAPSAERQAELQAALDVLRASLEQRAPDTASELQRAAEQARDVARAAAEEAAASMEAARAALEADAARGGASGAGRSGEPGEPGESGEGAEPGDPSESGEPSEGREAMERAARELDQVTEALERAERRATAARNQARADARTASDEALDRGETAENRAQRLEAIEPDEGPELLDRTRELLEELRRAREDAERGDLAGAQEAGRQAQADLNRLLQMLQSRQERASDEPPGESDPARLAELAAEQEEIEARTRDLMRRLEELEDQRFRQPMERAAAAMERASDGLRRGDVDQATRDEEEAAEELEQATDELEQERDRYEQLRQEEVLFRLREELESLKERQTEAALETKELDAAREELDRLSRSQRRAVARLAAAERELAGDADRLRGGIEEDGAIAFTFALERTVADLEAISDMLADERTDPVVQSTQQEVIERTEDLLAVLDDEMERRRDAEVEEGDDQMQGQQGQTPLVPPVAELLLLKRMEESALRRLELFEAMNPTWREEGVGPMELQLLERWALEHMRVSDLFADLVPEEPTMEMPVIEPEPGEGGDDGEEDAR